MQRRLVNALQDLSVKPDGTVRDNNGKIIQILYGEDGIDPAKSDYGKVADIDSIIENMRLKSKELPKKSRENSLSSSPVIKSKKITVHQRPTNNPVKSTQTISKVRRTGLDPVIQNVSPKGKVPAEFKIKLDGKTYDYYSLGYYQPKNSFGNRQNLFSKDILKFKGEKRMDYMKKTSKETDNITKDLGIIQESINQRLSKREEYCDARDDIVSTIAEYENKRDDYKFKIPPRNQGYDLKLRIKENLEKNCEKYYLLAKSILNLENIEESLLDAEEFHQLKSTINKMEREKFIKRLTSIFNKSKYDEFIRDLEDKKAFYNLTLENYDEYKNQKHEELCFISPFLNLSHLL